MGHNIRYFQTLPSTNLFIEENLSSLKDGDVVVAKHQSQGRGRLGRSWEASSGALTFSSLCKEAPEVSPCLLPLLSGVAIAKTIEAFGLCPSLKWPNDVMLGEKKCCGILVQGVSKGKENAYIVGIGVNLNQTQFPSELPNATSMMLVKGSKVDMQSFLLTFLDNFDSLTKQEAFLYFQSHDFLLGKKIDLSYYGEGISGRSKGIDEYGNLLLEKDTGETITISSGEATLHREK